VIAALAALLLAAAHPVVPNFGHVIVVVFENHERDQIVGSSDAPTFAALAQRYASLDSYDAVSHPSLPNYLALVSGSTQGITSDCTDCTARGKSLADTLAATKRTWKTYAEDLPSAGFTGATSGDYAKKHDPFLYFTSVLAKPSWRKRVVPLTQLAQDVGHKRLPSFSLVVPNLCNDMHDCAVATGDRWARAQLSRYVTWAATSDSLLVVTFDEDDDTPANHIATVLVGPMVRPGTYRQQIDHYNLLRTVEDMYRLSPLGLARRAHPLRCWKTTS
jgi:acid phosphatase